MRPVLLDVQLYIIFCARQGYDGVSIELFLIKIMTIVVCPICSSELKKVDQSCTNCSWKSSNQETDISETSVESVERPTIHNRPQDIGGWLSLVALGIILSPLVLLHALWTDIHVLTGPHLKLVAKMIPDLPALIVYELITNLLLLGGCLCLIVMFYRKKKSFPKYFCAVLIFSLLVSLVEFSICPRHASTYSSGPRIAKIVDDMRSKLGHTIGNKILAGIVWISYFIRSKRVKYTFVN
jgi:hypothetical protein